MGREVTTSVMCWPEHLVKIDDADQHSRIIAMNPGAGDKEWIAFARAIHAADPVTRIGSFYDDCRPQAAAVARMLGLHMHSAEVIELVTDKYAMRRRLAETGIESTVSAVVGDPRGLRGPATLAGMPGSSWRNFSPGLNTAWNPFLSRASTLS